MSKSSSGHFKGTVGAKGAGGGGGSGNILSLFVNGHVTEEGIAAHREEFIGKSVEQIAEILEQQGYKVNIIPSRREKSSAQIIEITNSSKERNITQVQVSPENNIHGVPYVKISRRNARKVKVIDSKPEDYKNSNNEKALLIFRRD